MNKSFFKNFKPLTREELKTIVGGTGGTCTTNEQCDLGECCSMYGYCGSSVDYCGYGTCTVHMTCAFSPTGSFIECSGAAGKCKQSNANSTGPAWVQCDTDPKVYCAV